MASFDEPTSIFSLILGVLLTALGIIPILSSFGVIGFGLPGFLNGFVAAIVVYIAAAAGVWLLVDGFLEDDSWQKITLLIGALILILAIIPILNQFGIIGFSLDFMTYQVWQYIITLEGLLMIAFPFIRI